MSFGSVAFGGAWFDNIASLDSFLRLHVVGRDFRIGARRVSLTDLKVDRVEITALFNGFASSKDDIEFHIRVACRSQEIELDDKLFTVFDHAWGPDATENGRYMGMCTLLTSSVLRRQGTTQPTAQRKQPHGFFDTLPSADAEEPQSLLDLLPERKYARQPDADQQLDEITDLFDAFNRARAHDELRRATGVTNPFAANRAPDLFDFDREAIPSNFNSRPSFDEIKRGDEEPIRFNDDSARGTFNFGRETIPLDDSPPGPFNFGGSDREALDDSPPGPFNFGASDRDDSAQGPFNFGASDRDDA